MEQLIREKKEGLEGVRTMEGGNERGGGREKEGRREGRRGKRE